MGRSMSFEIIITMKVSHILRRFSFIRVMEVILWCIFHILSLKYCLLSSHWVPSGANKLWWRPKYLPEGDVAVVSFHFKSIVYIHSMEYIFISACSYDLFFCFKLFEYFLIVGDMFSDEAFVIPFNSSWEKDV